VFPDYSLRGQTGTVRTLSELQARDPYNISLPFPRSLRDVATPLGPAMFRAAIVNTMTLRRFPS
jgi:hypothetical protein